MTVVCIKHRMAYMRTDLNYSRLVRNKEQRDIQMHCVTELNHDTQISYV